MGIDYKMFVGFGVYVENLSVVDDDDLYDEMVDHGMIHELNAWTGDNGVFIGFSVTKVSANRAVAVRLDSLTTFSIRFQREHEEDIEILFKYLDRLNIKETPEFYLVSRIY